MSGHGTSPGFRSGYCCLAGRPNAGKSTLLNALCGEKLAIVTAKPQTTRDRIVGIKTTDLAQLVFLDTPGLHRSDKPLNAEMMRQAREAATDADVIVYVADTASLLKAKSEKALREDLDWLKELAGPKVLVALNKCDLVEKPALLPLIERFVNEGYGDVVPISAYKKDGLEALENEIVARLPEGPPFYPADTLTEHTERFIAAEVIREKVFKLTHREIPYSAIVAIEDFKDRNDNLSAIVASIYVERDSQRRIVIGNKGALIKEIGTAARKELERMFDRRIFLDLRVKTRKDWTKDEKFIKDLGER